MQKTNSRDVLFLLLRSALCRQVITSCCLSQLTSEEWNDIFKMACQQRIMPTIFNGIELLPKTEHPPLKLKLEWIGQVAFAESEYAKHTNFVKHLVTELSQSEISLEVLKGIGLSKYYPIPNRRIVGDVDVFSRTGFAKINAFFKSKGYFVEETTPKHSVIDVKGIVVENHEQYLDAYATKVEEKVQAYLMEENDSILSNDGYYTLSPIKNYIFLLCHMSRHFAEYESIQLRHLVDWGMFIKGERKNIDSVLLKRKLQEFGLCKCNDLFTSLAQDVIGEYFSEFIFELVQDSEKERVMNEILREKSKDVPTCLISRVVYKLRMLLGNLWKYKYLAITMRERIWMSWMLHKEYNYKY